MADLVLEGRRLSLRPLSPADAGPLAEAVAESRDTLKRRLGWAAAADRADAERFIAESAERSARGEALVFGVFELRGGQRLCGVASLDRLLPAERGRGRLGMWIRRDRQDRGYAVEAGRLVLDLAFRKRGLHRVYARLEPANRAYRRVLKKLGFRYEGCLRDDRRLNGRWIDQECWGLLKSERKR